MFFPHRENISAELVDYFPLMAWNLSLGIHLPKVALLRTEPLCLHLLKLSAFVWLPVNNSSKRGSNDGLSSPNFVFALFQGAERW